MEWYEWVAYAAILVGVCYYIMKNFRNGGNSRPRRRNNPF